MFADKLKVLDTCICHSAKLEISCTRLFMSLSQSVGLPLQNNWMTLNSSILKVSRSYKLILPTKTTKLSLCFCLCAWRIQRCLSLQRELIGVIDFSGSMKVWLFPLYIDLYESRLTDCLNIALAFFSLSSSPPLSFFPIHFLPFLLFWREIDRRLYYSE